MSVALFNIFRSRIKSEIQRTCLYARTGCNVHAAKCYSNDNQENMAPIKFTNSKAAAWKAKESRGGDHDNSPWFQPYVVTFSLGIFMLYFFIFREENDIDLELDKSLYDRIPGLEEHQLQIALEYNETRGLPTTEFEQRLKELRAK